VSQQAFRVVLYSEEEPSLTVAFNHEAEAGDTLNRIAWTTLCEQLHNIHLGFRLLGQLKRGKQHFNRPALVEFLRSEPIPKVGQFLCKRIGRCGLFCCVQPSLDQLPKPFEDFGRYPIVTLGNARADEP